MKQKGAFKTYYAILILIICFNLLVPTHIFADTNAVLANIKLANTRDDLLTYFEVENAFKEKTVQAIQNGIPPVMAIQMATINTARCYKLNHRMHLCTIFVSALISFCLI